MKCLEGFHIHAAWGLSGKCPEQNKDGSWMYTHLEDVLKAVGLKLIAHYVDVQCQTVTNSIVNQPIHELCAGAVRKRGLPVQPIWWEQPMDLNLAWERGLRPLPNQGRGPVVIEEHKDMS
jgi:hypothetical protein